MEKIRLPVSLVAKR